MKFRPLFLGAICSIILAACLDTSGTSGTNDETTTSISRIYREDGTIAVGARARIYAVGDTQTTPRAEGRVDVNGKIILTSLPARGFYNLVVDGDSGRALFQDSLASDGQNLSVLSDTLRRTGRIIGRVHVQPQDRPQIAWVQLLGVGRGVNLDDSGYFALENIPAGLFTVAALTREPNYTPTFRDARIPPGGQVDLGTIDLIYTGLPVIQGVRAVYDSAQAIVHLSWLPSTDKSVLGYQILCGETNSPFASVQVGYVSGQNSWSDTLFREKVPGRLGMNQDSLATRLFYQVRAISAKLEGPIGMPDSVEVRSPFLIGAWSLDWKGANIPKGANIAAIDSLGGGLGLLEARDTEDVLWSSPDGVNWTVKLSLPARSGAVFWKGAVWWTQGHRSGRTYDLVTGLISPPTFAVSEIDSVAFHSFDGSVSDSVSFKSHGDSISSVVLASSGNFLIAFEAVTRVNYGTSMPEFDLRDAWASTDGHAWVLDKDVDHAWWVRTNVARPWYANQSDIRQVLGTAVPVLWTSATSGTELWRGDVATPTPRQQDAAARWTLIDGQAAIVGFSNTLVYAGQGLRWATLEDPTRLHRINSPTSDIRQMIIWRGQLLVLDQKSLWRAVLPSGK